DREIPGVGRPRLVAAKLARCLIHRAVERVAVDGRGAGVELDSRWSAESFHYLVEQGGTQYARIEDVAPVLLGITAVDIASGKVDADVAAFQLGGPWAGRHAVPCDGSPWRWRDFAAEDRDRISSRMKMPGEHESHLAAASRNYDAHRYC